MKRIYRLSRQELINYNNKMTSVFDIKQGRYFQFYSDQGSFLLAALEDIAALYYISELYGRVVALPWDFWHKAVVLLPDLKRSIWRIEDDKNAENAPAVAFTEKYLTVTFKVGFERFCQCFALADLIECMLLARHALPEIPRRYIRQMQKASMQPDAWGDCHG